MNRNRISLPLAAVLIGSVALVGCKKKEEAVATPAPAVEPAAMPPAPMPAPAAIASVTGIDLGTTVGADMKVAAPATTFAAKDTIHASVATATSDPAASVPGKLSAKWSFQDGQVVNEENRDITFAGNGNTDFTISKPDGWPVGKYKLEVMLNGAVVQTKDFEVK